MYAMKTSHILRFGVAGVLISVGCALLLFGAYRVGFLFGFATIVCMPRSEFTQPIPHRELWIMIGALFAIITAMVSANHFFSTSAADAAMRVICHPGFVVPLWLLMMWALIRNYQGQKSRVDS